MRLLFLTGSLAYGGAEHHAVTLSNALADRGHECHLAWIKPDAAQRTRLRLQNGGRAFSLDAARYLDRGALRRLAGTLALHRPAVLIAANPYALMYAVLARSLAELHVPLVVIYHSTRTSGFKEQLKLLAYRPCMWAAARTVFVSEQQRDYCLRRGLGSRRNTVIHNGIDLERFRDTSGPAGRRALRSALGITEADYVIGVAGGLRPEKNHVQLLEAIAELRALGSPARALFIGDGELRAAIESRARALGVAAHLTVTGFVEDVRPHMSACDVMCVCSLTEALSLAAIEAMAMGKPLVHSAVGGAAELLTPGENGLLYPAADTGALVECLVRLADPAARRAMGRAARRAAEDHFSEARMTLRYEELLRELCGAADGATARA
jgi:L-malate glycosyltransferase